MFSWHLGLGAAEVTDRSRWWNSFAPQWDFFPQTRSLRPYYVSVTALPGLGWPHDCPGRKSGNAEHGGRGASLWATRLICLGTLGSWVPWFGQRGLFCLHHLPLASESCTHLPGREGFPWLWIKESAKMPFSKEVTSHHSLKAKLFFQ